MGINQAARQGSVPRRGAESSTGAGEAQDACHFRREAQGLMGRALWAGGRGTVGGAYSGCGGHRTGLVCVKESLHTFYDFN